jgi:hypothetical protein
MKCAHTVVLRSLNLFGGFSSLYMLSMIGQESAAVTIERT